MTYQLFWFFFFLLLLLVLIVISEVLYKRFKWSAELSRKFLHVSGGLMCLCFPLIFKSHWWVLALTLIAFILLLFTYISKMLPSVHQTKRYSLGSVLFPIPVYACFLISEINNDYLFFYLPITLLAISDTAAEIGGNRWGHLTKQFFRGQKTLAGSICFFITALFANITWLYTGSHLSFTEMLLFGFLIALLTTFTELVTLHGWDNLTVPAIAILFLSFLL